MLFRSLLPARAARLIAATMLLVPLACVGSRISVAPNDYSAKRTAEQQAADYAHCETVARDLNREYSPPVTDVNLSSASSNFALITRYEAACMRVKGYQVQGRFGRTIQTIDLPDSAVEKIRAAK